MVIQHPIFPSFPFAFLAQDHKKVNLALSSGRRILQIEQRGQVAGVHTRLCVPVQAGMELVLVLLYAWLRVWMCRSRHQPSGAHTSLWSTHIAGNAPALLEMKQSRRRGADISSAHVVSRHGG